MLSSPRRRDRCFDEEARDIDCVGQDPYPTEPALDVEQSDAAPFSVFDRKAGGYFEGTSSTGYISVSVNTRRYSSQQLGNMLSVVNSDPSLGDDAGLTLKSNPAHPWIASDVAANSVNTDIGLFGLFVHEIGNSLAVQTGIENPFSAFEKQNRKRGVNDPDAGAAFETCVFGGIA